MPYDQASARRLTLQDLLSQNLSAQGPAGGFTAAQNIPGSPDMDAERQQALAMMATPENLGEGPQVDKPNRLAQILMGVGDALTAAAAIKGNSPGAKTHTLEAYMDYLARQKESRTQYDERKALLESRATKEKGAYLLSELDRKQARSDAAAATKEERAYQAKKEADRVSQDKAELETRAALSAEAASKEMAWKERMASAERRHEESLVKLRSQQENGSKTAKDQLEGLSQAKVGVNQIANNLPRLIQGYADQAGEHPGMKPDEIETLFRRSLAELNLDKDATEAARAYFDQEVGSQFQRLAGGGATGSW